MSIQLFKVFMSKNVDAPLLETLHSGWIGQGPKVEEFEDTLRRRIGNNFCLSLAAGTHGLHLALRLFHIRPGDEVITTPLTCTATNWPILMQGADIRWADIKKDDLNIDPESIIKNLTHRTRAIIVVHWGGYPCDMEEIRKIAKARNLWLIEDAAHAYGASYKGHPIGSCSHSDAAMFSFQAIKHLTTVDGGALFLNNPEHYQRGKLLRWYGIDREGPRKEMRCEENIPEWGYKYHMNDVCAVIGLANMSEANANIKVCQDNAEYYMKSLKNVPGVMLTQTKTDRVSSYWLFTILVEDRMGFSRLMGEKNIHVSRVHERNDKHSCIDKFRIELPVLEEVTHKMVCIPCGWWVSPEDRSYIVKSIKEGW
jgi:dTDP-4-amino-4,6-dideoxygalactose transaminase